MKLSKSKKIILYSIIVLYLIFVLFPIIWLIQSSFKSMYQALQIPPLLIWKPTFQAYQKVFGGGIYKAFLNSIEAAASNVLLCLLFGIPAAYGLARARTKISENIGFFILSVRMAPAFGIIVPIYIIFTFLHMMDTIAGVIVAQLTYNLPLAIWLLKGYFEGIPLGLEEAARVDGATRLQVLTKIIIPVGMPMIAAVSALVFLFSWNGFLFAFILTSQEARTVPVIVASLAGTMQFDWSLLSAVSTIALIPAFIFVGYVQKFIARGFTMGAVR